MVHGGRVQNDEQAIRHLVSTWLTASKNGKTEEVLKLMSEEVVFLMPGQSPMRKLDFIAGQGAMKDVDIQATADIQEIKVFGDWAYCWNNLAVVVTPRNGGPPVKRVGNVLSILRKEANKWVIFRDANMLTVAPE